jgi:DNA-binding MarR family transcriptional regulator
VPAAGPRTRPTETDYRRLATFRYALRRFLHFSESAARASGLSPTQYQLLLFVRGFPGTAPSVADLAERLQIAHQSAVGLIDRSARAGWVRRRRDRRDARRVRIALTPAGRRVLERLVLAHSPELARLSASLFRVRTR